MGLLASKCIPDERQEEPYEKHPHIQPTDDIINKETVTSLTSSNGSANGRHNSISASNGKNTAPQIIEPQDERLAAPLKISYNMNHNRRGIAVILNHYYFDKSTGLNPRNGTHKDVDALKQTFESLGFHVKVHSDLDLESVFAALKKTATKDHTYNDCLVVAVLTHGKLEEFVHGRTRETSHTILSHDQMSHIYARNGMFSIQKLFSFFTDQACPSLIGKPRMFFIQACQGDKIDHGHSMFARGARVETDSVGFEPDDVRQILPHPDYLIAYASFPGYFSMRNSEHGSWFIQALCKELNNRSNNQEYDILKILTFVAQTVAYDYESHTRNVDLDRAKQVPCINSMLTKLLYLREKFPSNIE